MDGDSDGGCLNNNLEEGSQSQIPVCDNNDSLENETLLDPAGPAPADTVSQSQSVKEGGGGGGGNVRNNRAEDDGGSDCETDESETETRDRRKEGNLGNLAVPGSGPNALCQRGWET